MAVSAPDAIAGGSFSFTSTNGPMTLASLIDAGEQTAIGEQITVGLNQPTTSDLTSTQFTLRNSSGQTKASGFWEYMEFGNLIGYLTINDRTLVPANLLSNPNISDSYSFSLSFDNATSGTFVATANVLNGGGTFTFNPTGGTTGGTSRTVAWNGAGPHNGGLTGQYTIADLGTLGGDDAYTFAYAVNSSGRVVGESGASVPFGDSTASVPHAFSGTTASLTDHSPGDFVYSAASGINDAGHVVGGGTQLGQTEDVAFVDTGAGPVQLPNVQGYTGGRASDINNAGQIVGSASGAPTQPPRAFLYQNEVIQDLGTLGGPNATANAINEAGHVVGGAGTGSSGRAYLYRNGAMQDLGTLPGFTHSTAADVNDSDVVVGRVYTGASNEPTTSHAFVFSGSAMQDLGVLPGYDQSAASGVNNAGAVVGTLTNITQGNECAFLWTNGVMVDLNTLIDPALGWSLEQASGINNAGQIVGNARVNGKQRAFLLTPRVSSPPTPPPGGLTIADVADTLPTVVVGGEKSARGTAEISLVAGSAEFKGKVTITLLATADGSADGVGDLTLGSLRNKSLKLNAGQQTTVKLKTIIPAVQADADYQLFATVVGTGVTASLSGEAVRIEKPIVDLAASGPAGAVTLVPGRKGTIGLPLVNQGNVSGKGTALVSLFASNDGEATPGQSLGIPPAKLKVSLAADQARTGTIKVTWPSAGVLAPGTYTLTASLVGTGKLAGLLASTDPAIIIGTLVVP